MSSPSSGGTGILQDKKFRENLSNLYIGRDYTDETKLKHRNNMVGLKFSEETPQKMSKSSGGVEIIITNVETQEVVTFKTKSAAKEYLNISIRTLSRWADSPTEGYYAPKLNIIVYVSYI